MKIHYVVFVFVGISFGATAQWSINGAGDAYWSEKAGIGTTAPTGQLEVVGTAIFKNTSWTTNGYVAGAVNIFKSHGDPGTVNTVLNLGNYWNSLSSNTSILAIDFRSGDGGGISTGNPSGRIKVQTSWEPAYMDFDIAGTTAMRLQGGDVNISKAIHIQGATNIDDQSPGIIYTSGDDFLYDGQYLNHYGLGFHSYNDGSGYDGINAYMSGYFGVDLFTGGQNRLRINSNGNIGIGTVSPDTKLAVKGTIHSQEVKVDMLGAMVPDYVFEKDYNLPSLDSIKTYIDHHKHLPEVPSAKDMEANGVNLGEMNMMLLKKMEEMTLYMIEQKAVTEDLIKENKDQQIEIQKLKDRE